jgi:hypothetical protein
VNVLREKRWQGDKKKNKELKRKNRQAVIMK